MKGFLVSGLEGANCIAIGKSGQFGQDIAPPGSEVWVGNRQLAAVAQSAGGSRSGGAQVDPAPPPERPNRLFTWLAMAGHHGGKGFESSASTGPPE